MIPEATLWAETQRLPLVACPNTGKSTPLPMGYLQHNRPGDRLLCPYHCNEDGEVRSDVYRTVKLAITVPHNDERGCPKCNPGFTVYPTQEQCSGTGRVLRPRPGVMACPDAMEAASQQPVALMLTTKPVVTENYTCSVCGAESWWDKELKFSLIQHNPVPDPSEAGVVARDESCGRLMPVHVALHEAGQQGTGLLGKLIVSDYDGAMPLILEAVRALAAVEA